MAEPRESDAPAGEEEGRMAPFGPRTFLGGGRVASRLRLYGVLCLVALAALGGVLYYADKQLARAERQTAEAESLQRTAGRIETKIWQLRSVEKEFVLSDDVRHVGVYQSIVKTLNAALNALESHAAAKAIKEHIATINDGLAQHGSAFERLSIDQQQDADAQAEKLAKTLSSSAKALETQLANHNIAGLTDSFVNIRKAEIRFKASGAASDLAAQEKSIDEFNRLLVSVPLPEKDRETLQKLIKAYQNDMTAYAKVKLSRTERIGRLDELFSYILPSVNGIVAFADNQVLQARERAEQSRRFVRTAIGGGAVTVLMLLALGGVILMQSLAAPVREIAGAAGKLVNGEQDVKFPAMGNRDEIGEVARALNIFKETLAEVSLLSRDLRMTRGALEQAQRTAEQSQASAREAEAKANEHSQRTQQLETRARNAEAKAGDAETRARAAEAKANDAEARNRETEAQLRTAQSEAAAAKRALEQARTELARLQRAQESAERDSAGRESAERPATAQKTPAPESETPAPDKASAGAEPGSPITAIASISQRLAESSQTASAAAHEAERTSALISGLSDAEAQLSRIDPLIRLIGKQTDFLAFSPNGRAGTNANDPHRNLVALSSGGDSAKAQLGIDNAEIKKRFETIRKAAIQVLQNVRAVAQTVSESKGAALEIAAASSADALEITTDLLDQSENLRGMLNDLIGKLHSTSLPGDKRNDAPTQSPPTDTSSPPSSPPPPLSSASKPKVQAQPAAKAKPATPQRAQNQRATNESAWALRPPSQRPAATPQRRQNTEKKKPTRG